MCVLYAFCRPVYVRPASARLTLAPAGESPVSDEPSSSSQAHAHASSSADMFPPEAVDHASAAANEALLFRAAEMGDLTVIQRLLTPGDNGIKLVDLRAKNAVSKHNSTQQTAIPRPAYQCRTQHHVHQLAPRIINCHFERDVHITCTS